MFVSEVMLQQTPVARVEPVWRTWMDRWPTPAALADEPAGEAVAAWGRLGYPRRALRLHAAAVAMTQRHGGQVPGTLDELRALPGVGEYTAAAVAAFAFGVRVPVVDTNIRRVQARAVTGIALPSTSLTRAEHALAQELLPQRPNVAVTWNVAVMELGALVCTARAPRCGACPVQDRCAWVAAGSPPYDGPPRRGQAWAGTDRQVRGVIVQALRDSAAGVDRPALEALWPEEIQRERCLDGLISDGLVDVTTDGRFTLPGRR